MRLVLTASLATLAIAVAPASAIGSPVRVAGPLCLGHPATIVGTPGATVTGTNQADVVVSDGAAEIRTGGGDDLVCLTGGRFDPYGSTLLSTGPGDDRVDATGSRTVDDVDLGPGDDRYVGGPHEDDVEARGDGTDVVDTRGGDDTVLAGGRNDHDRVDLGTGDDEMYAALDPTTTWRGGPGRDTVDLRSDQGATRHRWVYDDGRHPAAYRDGHRVLTWSGFERFSLPQPAVGRSFEFRGGPGAETLDLQPMGRPTRVDMGGGDDEIDLSTTSIASAGLDLDGGSGRDLVRVVGDLDLDGYRLKADIDLARSRISFGDAGSANPVSRLTGVEDAFVEGFDRVTLRGDAHDNRLVDRGKNPLIGRADHSLADGGAGRDHCVAEVTRRCES